MMNKLDSKNYYEATITTRVWYLCQENHIDQRNEKQNPEIILHLFSTKMPRQFSWCLDAKENK